MKWHIQIISRLIYFPPLKNYFLVYVCECTAALRVLGLMSIVEYFKDNLQGVTFLVIDIKPFVAKTVCYQNH